jgi:hypothetical protein
MSFNLWMQSGRGWLGFNFLCLIAFEVWVRDKGLSSYTNIVLMLGIVVYLVLGTIFMLSSTVDFKSRLIVLTIGVLSCLMCILIFVKKIFH